MKLNRKLVLVLSLVLSLALATGGTLAYLTDRDSAANVFTIGNVDIELNEDFIQDSTLLPGVDVEKKPTITNTGKNDAWVWATIAIPATLDDSGAAYNNVLHFNYETESVEDGLWNWQDEQGAWRVKEGVKIDETDILYNVYTVLYETPLKPGETTEYPVMTKVYLDTHVDITPEGDMYWVDAGVATDLNWNINEQGGPIMYVSAYAIQTNNFDDVVAAYNAYNTQWGENGTEYGNGYPSATATASSTEELNEAIAAGNKVIKLADGTYDIGGAKKVDGLTLIGSDNTVLTVKNEGESGCDYGFDSSSVTFCNVTFDTTANKGAYPGYARMNGTYNDCTFKGQYTLYGVSEFNNCVFDISGDKYNLWTWGAPTAEFNNCVFNSDGKAVLLYGQANTKLTLNNCTFNDNGGLSDLKAAVEIGNDYNKSYELIVNDTVVNGYEINDKGISTGTTLWGNKNSMGTDKLNVVVDGVDVY